MVGDPVAGYKGIRNGLSLQHANTLAKAQLLPQQQSILLIKVVCPVQEHQYCSDCCSMNGERKALHAVLSVYSRAVRV